MALADEREALEALQRRASLAVEADREVLEANPDAIELPAERIAGGQVLVADNVHGDVGCAVVRIDGERAELDGLFVEPEHWRGGIGSLLVDAAVHEARRAGLTLTVVSSRDAQAFYEKCGFAVEGPARTRFGPALRMSR
ncbi:MAG TPA: GNAT family N-acetyltransferase [Reyranellaceae bacterium]|nr:GNAT family N-acetyltransferase [Reyranellaceae bacterium]